MNLLPNVKSWLQDTIEELVSDSLVDPGRYLIDMSGPEMDYMLIFGVRKLKRTVLQLQVGKRIRISLNKFSLNYKFESADHVIIFP